jgi:hypothetical protein
MAALTACSDSDSELPIQYRNNEETFEYVAKHLIENFKKIELADTCSDKVDSRITFSKEYFNNCFQDLPDRIKSPISDFLSKDVVNYIFVYPDKVSFKVEANSNFSTTTFKDVDYYPNRLTKSQIKELNYEKTDRPNWYFKVDKESTF